MGNVFSRNQALGSQDLRIEFKNAFGLHQDPLSISYSLFDMTLSDVAIRQKIVSPILIGEEERIPLKLSTGVFYSDWSVPASENLGAHKIVWKYQDSDTGTTKSLEREFAIVGLDPRFAIQGIAPSVPVIVAPPVLEEVAFSIYKGTDKTLKTTLLDDFGGPLNLTGYSAIILRMSASPVFQRNMTPVGSIISGEVIYTFLPADTQNLSVGIYEAQVTASFMDGRIIKTDLFKLQILEPI